MSERTAGYLNECNHCSKYDGCLLRLCDRCGTCEGSFYNLTDDFDLCVDCYLEIAVRIFRSDKPVDQGQRSGRDDHKEERLVVIRNTITEQERNFIFDRDGRKCLACQSTQDLQVDHVIPFSRGGNTSPDNLQTLCKKCNIKKRDWGVV